MQVLCKPEGRLTENVFPSTIIRTIIILSYFFMMQNLRFIKDACMHFNCNNELEVSQTLFPRHCCFCLAFRQISKGALIYCTEKSLITLFIFLSHTHTQKKRKNKNLCHCIDWQKLMVKQLGWYSRLLVNYVSKASCFSVFSSPPVEMVDFLHAIGLMYI